MPWTRFMDMHSGGGNKEPQEYIYIEAPEAVAVAVFYNRFGHNPHRVTCTCCGSDYSISEEPTLEEATASDRGDYDAALRRPGPVTSVEEYVAREDVLVIRSEDIKPEERQGTVPEQGYVWVD